LLANSSIDLAERARRVDGPKTNPIPATAA